jgi:hypothetical protein
METVMEIVTDAQVFSIMRCMNCVVFEAEEKLYPDVDPFIVDSLRSLVHTTLRRMPQLWQSIMYSWEKNLVPLMEKRMTKSFVKPSEGQLLRMTPQHFIDWFEEVYKINYGCLPVDRWRPSTEEVRYRKSLQKQLTEMRTKFESTQKDLEDMRTKFADTKKDLEDKLQKAETKVDGFKTGFMKGYDSEMRKFKDATAELSKIQAKFVALTTPDENGDYGGDLRRKKTKAKLVFPQGTLSSSSTHF